MGIKQWLFGFPEESEVQKEGKITRYNHVCKYCAKFWQDEEDHTPWSCNECHMFSNITESDALDLMNVRYEKLVSPDDFVIIRDAILERISRRRRKEEQIRLARLSVTISRLQRKYQKVKA